jgi:t-SNARE complex subunit (syntaxin)
MKVLQSVESFLASRQGDIDKLNAAIQKAKLEVENAKVKLPEAIKAAATAKQPHDQALSNTWKAMDARHQHPPLHRCA